MSCACDGICRFFDEKTASKDLRRYRRKGPSAVTRLLLDAIRREGIQGRTLLDIGGGVGPVHHELLASGAVRAVDADASPAYAAASRLEAERRGHADRIEYHVGDFVEIADGLAPADVVVLDRVLCCYPDVDALVEASVGRARGVYAYSIPRDRFGTRLAFAFLNALQALRRHPFRVHLHRPGGIAERVRGHGFDRRFLARSFLWQVEVYGRAVP